MFSLSNAVSLTMKHSISSKWNILFDKPEQWMAFQPKAGVDVYPCYACRNLFSTKSSFRDHINRRVILIKYNCNNCSTTITFYNRCAFLLHARKHFPLQEGKINLSNVDIHLLPLGLAGFTRENNLPYLYDDKYEEQVDDDVHINSQFYRADEKDYHKQLVTMKPFNLVFYCNKKNNESNVCLALRQIALNIPHCKFVVEEDEQKRIKSILYKKNYNTPPQVVVKQEPTDVLLSLTSKSDTVNSTTSSSTTTTTTKICPECNVKQNFLTMNIHFLGNNTPIDVNLFCNVCKFMAPSSCSLKAHKRIHMTKAPFVCPECGEEFKSFSLLLTHMDETCFHLIKQIRYKCLAARCGKMFALAKSFATHFNSHIQMRKVCNNCSKSFIAEYDIKQHKCMENVTFNLTYICLICKDVSLAKGTLEKHMNWHASNTQRCIYIYACRLCRSNFRSACSYANHKKRCMKREKFLNKLNDNNRQEKNILTNKLTSTICVYCNQRIFYIDKDDFGSCPFCNKINHMRKINEINEKKIFFCMLCKDEVLEENKKIHLKSCKLNNAIDIVPHVVIDNDDDADDDDDDDDDNDDNDVNNDNSNDNCLNKPKKVITLVEKSKKTESSNDNQVKDSFFDNYVCRLCNFKRKDRSEFQEHIITHRDLSTTYQCMECGECFIVKNSLINHLIHYHKIVDIEQYLKNNTCFNNNRIEDLEKLKKNQLNKRSKKINQCQDNKSSSNVETDKIVENQIIKRIKLK